MLRMSPRESMVTPVVILLFGLDAGAWLARYILVGPWLCSFSSVRRVSARNEIRTDGVSLVWRRRRGESRPAHGTHKRHARHERLIGRSRRHHRLRALP